MLSDHLYCFQSLVPVTEVKDPHVHTELSNHVCPVRGMQRKKGDLEETIWPSWEVNLPLILYLR